MPVGHYYSFIGTANELFSEFATGTNEKELTKIILSRFLLNEEVARKESLQFIETLVSYQLLEEVELIEPNNIVEGGEKRHFEKPKIEKFDDMQELLMLDPVHEVDNEKGWPFKKSS